MTLSAYGPAVLRLALAALFIAHGAQKLFGAWGGGGLRQTAAAMAAAGLDRPLRPLFEAVRLDPSDAAVSVATLVACMEFGGGLLLLAGLLTRWAAAALAIEMLVATYRVHLPNGFFLNWQVAPGIGHGVEMNLVLVGALVSLLFTGPGALSIEARREASRREAAFGRQRVRSR